jgi:hypothetical protein
MELQHFAYLMALAVGIVSSRIICMIWEMTTDEDIRLSDLFDPNPDFMTPFRALAIVFAAPSKVITDGFGWLIAQPLIGAVILMVGCIWSFMQGVFILTTVLGFP